MKLKDIIGSMTAKFAALALALTCAGNVWATTVATEAELRAAIANGGAVTLGADIALTQGEIAVSNTVTLDLGTYTISSPTNVFRVAANGNFTVNADASNPGGISTATNRCCVYASYGWDPGAKTVVLNGGVFTGNCVFNWAASALSAYVSYENYGLAVDGAGSGEKTVPTSVTINGGTFTGGYELGNVGAYRCYYFTVNGGTFEKGLDCADTRYCSIGVTTTCKAYFNGGRYRDRYPTFRKKKQGLSVVDDPGKVFIGTASHTNSYYIAGGYYVNAYDRSVCEVTGTYAGAAVQNSYLIFLTTGYPQRWYNPSATWYFLTEADADDVGATNVIHINGENGSLPQLQTAAASSSAIRLGSGKRTLLAASKSAASTEVAPARLLSAAPVRLLSTASAPADVITTRPARTELGEIKVVGNDNNTYLAVREAELVNTVFKTELDAERIDACYFFGPASSPYITENDGSDDATAYAEIVTRISEAMTSATAGEDDGAAINALMGLSFTAAERQLLLDNAETLASGDYKITADCFSENTDGTYGLNFEGGGMVVITCVYANPTLATSDADPFENDPHLTWDLSLVVSFDKAVSADSVRFWWAAGGSNTVGDDHLKDSGTSVGALAANEVLSLPLGSGNKFNTFFLLGTGAPFPLLVAVQNLSNANNGTAVKVALRATNPNNSSGYADRASFTHVFGRDTIVAAKPVEGRFEEYNSAEGPNVHWGEWNIDAENDEGTKMGIVYSSTRTALETAFNAIENASETGLENVSIAAGERETQQKWVQIEWHGLVGVRNGYPMTTLAFGIEPQLRSIVADENNEVTNDTTRAITNAEIDGKTITFRLPLTDDYTARALVVHTSSDYPEARWIANVEGEAGARYVEISTTHFSEFTVSPLGANDIVYVTSAAGAFIGGYETLADAYAATEDGGTIYLLQNVSEPLEVAAAKTFNINANGFTYSGTVTAASGYVLSATTSGNVTTYAAALAIAQIGTTKYETLAEALKAANSGDTIEILDGTWGADAIAYDSLTLNEKLTIRTKSLTVQAAEGAAPKFVANVILGYDDSKTVNASMTVKGLAFENAKLSIGEYVQVTVENCSFTGSGADAALAIIDSCVKTHLIADEYPTAQVTVKNCTFDGTETSSPAIRVRNGGNVTITGNTIANSNQNGITVESNGDVNSTPVKTVLIQGNTITEWNVENVSGDVKNRGGRGVRLALGTLAEGSTVTVEGNTFRKGSLGLDEPDFVKITGAGSAAVDISGNDWNNMLLSEVKGNSAIYTSDGTTTLASVVTTRKEPVAQIGVTKYETLAEAFAAVQDGNTITLLADCETGIQYTIGNPLVLRAKNATLDLNGKTITATGNFSFLISGNNAIVKNGTIQAGANTAKKTGINSYAIVVNGCDGVKLSGLTVNGGVSVGGSTDGTPNAAPATNVVIEDCTVISGDYYAVCSQQNSAVTIASGSYTANPKSPGSGILYASFKGADGPKGTIYVTGGKFAGTIPSGNKAGDIVISGGIFSITPASYCAVGYKVVANDDEATMAEYQYTVAHVTGYIVEKDNGEGYAVIPSVDEDWIATNVTKDVATATTEKIEEALNKPDEKTNLKKWEAYVLNQTEPIKVTEIADTGALSTTLVEAKTGTGLDVSYSLVKVNSSTGAETDGTASESKTFTLEKADGSLETGLYKVRVHFKPTGNTSASEVTVDSVNTVGVLKTTPASKLVVVPVPFKALGGSGEINVSDYIKSGLANGDVLHVYNGDKYDTWTYNGSSWDKTTNVTKTDENTESTSESAEPSDATLARGTAAILRRSGSTDAPLVFVGDYTGAAEQQTIAAGWNLVASPSIEPFKPADKFKSGKIQIPTDNIPLNYTFKNGEWGYSGVIKKNGMSLPARIVVDTLPEGTGFWYISDKATTVTW